MKHQSVMLAALLGASVMVAACKKEEPTPVEKAVESTQDALDMRENEAAKDAVEDLQSAGENAAEAIEEKAEEMGEAMKESTEEEPAH
ncbi:hypothetical protein [Sinimarinibacterium thermocellulolyticum]|uniref:Lipoprotein n=1 Tax=Sinimarinibacterium thermocellulolyticum TaxID=3170016 RepID=A0ABV2A5M5_9GAMM